VSEGRGLAVMVGHLAEGAFRPFDRFDPDRPSDFLKDHGAWLTAQSGVTAYVHGNPAEPQIGSMVAGLAAVGPVFLIGGLSAAGEQPMQVCDRVCETGLSGLLLGDDVPVITGLTQGCSPIGPVHRVTSAADNVIMGIDGHDALEVLKTEAGDIIARDLQRAAGYIHIARPVEGSDNLDYVVRNLVGVDPQRGWLAIGDQCVIGDRMMFVCRDPNTAQRDMTRMLNGLAKRVAGRLVKGGLFVSCVARGGHMFGHDGRETEMIRAALGDFPLVGYSASGEICNDRLYGYTGILTLFL
jgi:small ligand-binding sensory domain FIST